MILILRNILHLDFYSTRIRRNIVFIIFADCSFQIHHVDMTLNVANPLKLQNKRT